MHELLYYLIKLLLSHQCGNRNEDKTQRHKTIRKTDKKNQNRLVEDLQNYSNRAIKRDEMLFLL